VPQPENAAEQEVSAFLVIAQMMVKKRRSDFAKAKLRTLPSIVPYSIFDVSLF